MAKKKTEKVAKSKALTLNPENYKEVPVDKIIIENWNYKKTDEKLQKKLVKNIEKNGQIENLLVRNLGDGTYGLVNGHHRLDALKELKYESAYVYDLGGISLTAAKRIGIETNETKFKSDNLQLAELLSDLTDEFGLEELELTMPYSSDELENFAELLEFDWDTQEEEEKESKSHTAVSAGGDKFRTLKLELSPELADAFEKQINRLKKEGGDSETPIQLIVDFIAKHDVETIKGNSHVPSKKRRKKRIQK